MTLLLFFLLIHQIQTIKILPGDLVYVTNLKHQNGTQTARDASHFNNSFGVSVGQCQRLNRQQNCTEHIIRSISDPIRHLRIRRKYLKLIPKIKFHDTSKITNLEMVQLWFNLTSNPGELTLFPYSHSSVLKFRFANHTKNIHRMLEPIVLLQYPSMYFIELVSNQWQSTEAFMRQFVDFMLVCDRSVVKQIFAMTKEASTKSSERAIIGRLSKLYNGGKRRESWPKEQFEKMVEEAVAKIIGQTARFDFVSSVWTQFMVLVTAFKKSLKKNYGTDDWNDLLCFDVARLYYERALGNCRTVNVILPPAMR